MSAALLSPVTVAALLVLAAYGGWLAWRRRRDPVLKGLAYAHGEWRAVLEQAEEVPLRLRGFTLWPGLIALDFVAQRGHRRFAVTLWPDSCPRDQWRRLRVLLNHTPPAMLSGVSTVSTASGRVSG